MSYLKREEFVPFAPDDGQIHINHINCQAGVDTKKRLYIRRTEDGIVAYCHHCGLSGIHTSTTYRSLKTIKRPTSHSGSGGTTISLPTDYEVDPRGWPTLARAWVYKYGITDAEIKSYGLGYSETQKRVILPAWEDGNLLGYQARKIFIEDTAPRYLTYWNKKNYVWKDLTSKNNILVICEDVLSAIKLHRFYASIALLNTHLHKDNYKYVFGFSKVLIYLDNNNAEVKMNAVKLKNNLSMYVPDTTIIHIDRDPKLLINKELESLSC